MSRYGGGPKLLILLMIVIILKADLTIIKMKTMTLLSAQIVNKLVGFSRGAMSMAMTSVLKLLSHWCPKTAKPLEKSY